MKKVLFCLSLIFGLLVLNSVPSFAMGFTMDLPTIGGLGDLGYGLIGGAEYDFSGSDWTISNYSNLSEQLKAEAAEQKAREFLQAYCIARGIPIPNATPDLPATTGKEFYKSMYFDSANRTVWNNYKLGRTTLEQQEALRFPISPQSFADWSGYSAFWYKHYTAQMDINISNNVFDVPVQYVNQINKINGNSGSGYDFFWSDYTVWDGSHLIAGPASNWSWAIEANNPQDLVLDNRPFDTRYMFPNTPFDVLIIGDDTNGYIVKLRNYQGREQNVNSLNNLVYRCYANTTQMVGASPSSVTGSQFFLDNTELYGYYTLSQCLDYIATRFRNVNIYVNNEQWAACGANTIDQAPANPIIPDFNDVIGGNDEDPIPGYDVVFPNSSDYEGTFDITSIFDAIKEAIIGASDNDDSTDSTLTRDKVTDTYRTKTGEAVGEKELPIDAVLDDSFPVQGTLNYPALPPIPQIPLDNAFAGTTILSELIDACQQILPSPLSLAFWGMIFILFIIGLIRILHK